MMRLFGYLQAAHDGPGFLPRRIYLVLRLLDQLVQVDDLRFRLLHETSACRPP